MEMASPFSFPEARIKHRQEEQGCGMVSTDSTI
jgi:hypothetical protein